MPTPTPTPPPRRLWAVALTLMLLAWPCASAAQPTTTQEPVYLLNAVFATDQYSSDAAAMLWIGMDAGFYNAQYTTASGQPITILQPNRTAEDKDSIVGVVRAALREHNKLLAVLGPVTDLSLVSVLGDSTLRDSGLVFLGPLTSSSAVRQWNDAVYFTRPEPMAELQVMLWYILNIIRARHTAFMYLSETQVGEEEYAYVQNTLASMSRTPAALYTAPFVQEGAAVNQTAFDAMANTRPQVVIVWGVPGTQLITFVRTLLADPRMSSAYVMIPSSLQQVVFDAYYVSARNGTTTPRNGQVMSSTTVLPVPHTQARHIALFRKELANYVDHAGKNHRMDGNEEPSLVDRFGKPSPSALTSWSVDSLLRHLPSSAQLMLEGWITAKVVLETLANPSWTADRAAYKAGLFRQNRYIIGDDLVLGDYGGECTEQAAATGAVCECNQGGHTSYLMELRDAAWWLSDGTAFTVPQAACYASSLDLPRPVNTLTILLEGSPELTWAGMEANALMRRMGVAKVGQNFNINFNVLNTTAERAQAAFDAYVENYAVDIVPGPMSTHLDVGDLFVPAPLFSSPRLIVEKRNYLYIMPTLEQQMYLLYENLADVCAVAGASTTTSVVLRGYPPDEAASIATLLYKTAGTFNVPEPVVTRIASHAPLGAALKHGAVNFLIGVVAGDEDVIAGFLAASPNAAVVVCFDDLTLHYDALVAALRSTSAAVQERFLFFNSLPLWTDTTAAALAASPVLQRFHAATRNESFRTPLHMRNYVTSSFVQEVILTTATVNSTTLTDTVYRNGVVARDDVTFGRFRWECVQTALETECFTVNYGAQSITIVSMRRVLDPATARVVVTAQTPQMTYAPRMHSGLTAAQRSGVIAGCVVGGVLLIAALVLLWSCCRDSRDNAAAPKEGEHPVTLIFTDIESSTALWATLPQLMADAIAAHHRVIRQLIKKHGCYEVKTIGDSFMIACGDAYSAVQLACEIQSRLLEYDWGTTQIDSKYREFELVKSSTVEDYVPPTARLSEEEYAALWRGLRVRIGIHTGLSDIRYDDVTKGYDYYGDTSNMAARTEAVANGGQVVATEATWWALSDKERDEVRSESLGAQGLRGVPYAVGMYQLNPVPGRTHAALRTEIEAILPDSDAAENASSNADALLSSAETMTGAAAGVALAISGCFAPYPPAQRVRELQPLLNKWNIGAPPRSKRVSEEDYCTGLINRLAIRIASVTQARQSMANGSLNWGKRLASLGSAALGNPLKRSSITSTRQLLPSVISDQRSTPAHQRPVPEPQMQGRVVGSTPLHRADVPSRRVSSVVVRPLGDVDLVVPFSAARGFGSSQSSSRSSSFALDEVVVRVPAAHQRLQRTNRSESSNPLTDDA